MGLKFTSEMNIRISAEVSTYAEDVIPTRKVKIERIKTHMSCKQKVKKTHI